MSHELESPYYPPDKLKDRLRLTSWINGTNRASFIAGGEYSLQIERKGKALVIQPEYNRDLVADLEENDQIVAAITAKLDLRRWGEQYRITKYLLLVENQRGGVSIQGVGPKYDSQSALDHPQWFEIEFSDQKTANSFLEVFQAQPSRTTQMFFEGITSKRVGKEKITPFPSGQPEDVELPPGSKQILNPFVRTTIREKREKAFWDIIIGQVDNERVNIIMDNRPNTSANVIDAPIKRQEILSTEKQNGLIHQLQKNCTGQFFSHQQCSLEATRENGKLKVTSIDVPYEKIIFIDNPSIKDFIRRGLFNESNLIDLNSEVDLSEQTYAEGRVEKGSRYFLDKILGLLGTGIDISQVPYGSFYCYLTPTEDGWQFIGAGELHLIGHSQTTSAFNLKINKTITQEEIDLIPILLKQNPSQFLKQLLEGIFNQGDLSLPVNLFSSPIDKIVCGVKASENQVQLVIDDRPKTALEALSGVTFYPRQT